MLFYRKYDHIQANLAPQEESAQLVLQRAVSEHNVSDQLIPAYLQEHLKEQVQAHLNLLREEKQDLLKLPMMVHPPQGSSVPSRPVVHLSS